MLGKSSKRATSVIFMFSGPMTALSQRNQFSALIKKAVHVESICSSDRSKQVATRE